jgi:hypothetical protein
MKVLYILFGLLLYTHIGGLEQFAYVVESDVDYLINLYYTITTLYTTPAG